MSGSSRRRFNQGVLAALSAAASPFAWAKAAGNQRAQAFERALAERPWLSAYQSVAREEYQANARVTHGRYPEALAGSLYRNGPAKHEVEGFRYAHWFDGDGMLHRYHFDGERVSHRAKLIATHKVVAERQAKRPLYPTFGSVPPNASPVRSPDEMNVANISVLHHNDRLLALWEAGSPYEVDPETLATKGVYAFAPAMAGVPFSAHPRVEADGTLWNFGYFSSAGLIVLWHLDKQGKLVKAGKLALQDMSMPHDFVVTAKHIVLLLTPLHYHEDRPGSFLDRHEWRPDQPTRIAIIDKNDFDRVQYAELPAQWVFHFSNAWEDAQGHIIFEGARTANPSTMTRSFKSIMSGQASEGAPPQLYQYSVNTRNQSATERMIGETGVQYEFPAINPQRSCIKHSQITLLSGTTGHYAKHGEFNEVRQVDLARQTTEFHRYPEDQIPEEHIFVPRPNSSDEGDGWVIGTTHNWRAQRTEVNVFASGKLADGPIFVAELPYAIPLGLHGKFRSA